MRRMRLPGALLAAVCLALCSAPAASAFHDFSACPNALTEQPPVPATAGTVSVSDPGSAGGFFNDSSGSPVTTISAGQSVTWIWETPNCHSVTFDPAVPDGPGSFATDNPELRHPNGANNALTLRFDTPGRFTYYCVHHWYNGMVGVVVVNP